MHELVARQLIADRHAALRHAGLRRAAPARVRSTNPAAARRASSASIWGWSGTILPRWIPRIGA